MAPSTRFAGRLPRKLSSARPENGRRHSTAELIIMFASAEHQRARRVSSNDAPGDALTLLAWLYVSSKMDGQWSIGTILHTCHECVENLSWINFWRRWEMLLINISRYYKKTFSLLPINGNS
jgi:hypothetical protein